MARPITFTPTAVLDAASAEFRIHGYADTTTRQICEAAGVRRSSLYNTFISKDELFLKSLERYTEVMAKQQEEILSSPDMAGGARLWKVVELVVDEERAAQLQGHAAGCMVVNTFMSPDARENDPRVQIVMERDFEKRLSLLTRAARSGQRSGDVHSGTDPEEIALLITTVISGLRVASHAGVPPEQLINIARISLGAVLL